MQTILKQKIDDLIAADLIIGRYENFGESLSQTEINTFLNANNDSIHKIINEIIEDYDKEDLLENLNEKTEDGWLRFYIYDRIDYNKIHKK